MSKTAVFTIASKNYLAYVRVLLTSVAKVHPEYDLYLCLVDRVDGYFDPAKEPFTVIQADQIGIPTFDDMALRYDIMEFNTAVKPFMFQWLFENTKLDAVIYLDPDIRAYSRFEKLEDALDAGASIVLTPHISHPLEDGKIPNDYNMLKSGVFNLGFIAARRCEEALDFLGWWGRRLATQAVADFASNLFTDQRWCDLAPCFLDQLKILKSPGYNVAYWNLAHQQIKRNKKGVWEANGAPLAFFHFSGVSADKENVVSKYQDRFEWSDIPECRPLFDEYSNALFEAGWGETKTWPYAYSQVTGGFVVIPIVRQLFRMAYPEPLVIEPSEVASVLIRLCNDQAQDMPGDENGTITRLMYAIYAQRPDVQAAFLLGTPEGRRAFISWFADAGPREYGLPASVTRHLSSTGAEVPGEAVNQRPVAVDNASGVSADQSTQPQDAPKEMRELNPGENNEREPSALNASNASVSTVRSLDELLSFDDETFVSCAYLTLLGHIPDHQGRMYYLGRLKNGKEKLEIICQLCLSPEGRQRNDSVSVLKIAILHRIWILLPKGMQKSVENIWARLIADTLQTKASSIPNSTAKTPQNEKLSTVSKLDFFDQPAEITQLLGDQFISNLMHLIWRSRPDLQQAFDLTTDVGQSDFAVWYEASAEREYGLKPVVPKHSEMKLAASDSASWTTLQGLHGANLIGYAHAELGMGEHVRMTAAALKNTDIAFGVVNFDVGVASRQKATLDHGELTEGNPYIANIFHINADMMLLAFCHLGREFFSRHYNIGYWAWELAKCPEDWIHAIKMVDEIWAPSRFIQHSFAEKTDKPVEYMPLCVTLPPLKGYSRKHYGLPQKAFVYLYTFDFFSYLDRKNPFAAIQAFKLAFPNKNHRVVLVLKTMNGDQQSPLWSKMRDIIAGDQRIIVMNKTIDRDEIIGLFNVCDCFVSLHRSEGFGRGPAEAMYLGKPVIVTNYSGNTDFTLPDNSCLVNYKLIPVDEGQYPFYQNQVWADPDVEHAAWYMKKVFEDHAFSKGIGKRGQEFIHQNFNQDAIGALYAKRLHELGLA